MGTGPISLLSCKVKFTARKQAHIRKFGRGIVLSAEVYYPYSSILMQGSV